jgi:hypothetical protein
MVETSYTGRNITPLTLLIAGTTDDPVIINGGGAASPCETSTKYTFVNKYESASFTLAWTKVFRDSTSIPWISLVSDGWTDYDYMGLLLVTSSAQSFFVTLKPNGEITYAHEI